MRRRRWFYAVPIIFVLLLISGMTAGCAGLGNPQPSSATNIATVETMYVGIVPIYGTYNTVLPMYVTLKPQNAQRNTEYKVELYEKGNLRALSKVMWNQPELNVGTSKIVIFNLSEEEFKAYGQASLENSDWWKPIFSIEVHE